jgi:RNA polymerase sigma-70 factor (ECF subfamily)
LLEEPPIAIPSELEQAFRSHHGLVFATAYRITGNAADAEDVLQTVFLRLLRRTSDSDAVEHHESYLRRAAVNASLDVIRSRQLNPAVELVEVPGDHAESDVTELRQVLGRALSKLQPRSAEIFALRFIEGMSNLEIARTLGISQVLVAVTIFRTRRELRKELAKHLGDRS